MTPSPIFSAVFDPAGTLNANLGGANEAEDLINTIKSSIKKFLIAILSIFVLVVLWAWIAVSILSFVRPDNKTANGENDFKNEITPELDYLFPDNSEKAPYGFEWKRGIPDKAMQQEYTKAEKDKATTAKEEGGDDDSNKESFIVKKLRYDNDDKISSWPYTWGTQEINKETHLAYYDKEPDSSFIANYGYGKTLFDILGEWLSSSIFFSFSKTRTIMKWILRWLKLFMINKMPSPTDDITKEDKESDYAYMSNVMVGLILPIVFLLLVAFYLLGIGPLLMVVGSVYNQITSKITEGGKEYDTAKKTHLGRILEGLGLTLTFGTFTIFPFAGASYFIQPVMFFGKLLIYPLFRSLQNWKKIFFEVVPMLVLIFTIGMALVAFDVFTEPFNYIIAVTSFLVYGIIFKDNLTKLFAVITAWKSNMIKQKKVKKLDDTSSTSK